MPIPSLGRLRGTTTESRDKYCNSLDAHAAQNSPDAEPVLKLRLSTRPYPLFTSLKLAPQVQQKPLLTASYATSVHSTTLVQPKPRFVSRYTA